VPWIAGEVLVRAKLKRVHEDAHGEPAVLAAGAAHQGEMSRVERAHRRDEADRLAAPASAAREVAHRRGAAHDAQGSFSGADCGAPASGAAASAAPASGAAA